MIYVEMARAWFASHARPYVISEQLMALTVAHGATAIAGRPRVARIEMRKFTEIAWSDLGLCLVLHAPHGTILVCYFVLLCSSFSAVALASHVLRRALFAIEHGMAIEVFLLHREHALLPPCVGIDQRSSRAALGPDALLLAPTGTPGRCALTWG